MRWVIVVIKVTAFTMPVSFSHRYSFNCVCSKYNSIDTCFFILHRYMCIYVRGGIFNFYCPTIKKNCTLFSLLKVFFPFPILRKQPSHCVSLPRELWVTEQKTDPARGQLHAFLLFFFRNTRPTVGMTLHLPKWKRRKMRTLGKWEQNWLQASSPLR